MILNRPHPRRPHLWLLCWPFHSMLLFLVTILFFVCFSADIPFDHVIECTNHLDLTWPPSKIPASRRRAQRNGSQHGADPRRSTRGWSTLGCGHRSGQPHACETGRVGQVSQQRSRCVSSAQILICVLGTTRFSFILLLEVVFLLCVLFLTFLFLLSLCLVQRVSSQKEC